MGAVKPPVVALHHHQCMLQVELVVQVVQVASSKHKHGWCRCWHRTISMPMLMPMALPSPQRAKGTDVAKAMGRLSIKQLKKLQLHHDVKNNAVENLLQVGLREPVPSKYGSSRADMYLGAGYDLKSRGDTQGALKL